jgi:hypothetical protein
LCKELKIEQSGSDTRKKSLSEALLNSVGGYPIGYAIGIVILPVSVGWIEKDPITVNLLITAVYATVSFLRSYYLRRFFAKYGINDNIAVLTIKVAKKLKNRLLFYTEKQRVFEKIRYTDIIWSKVRPAK